MRKIDAVRNSLLTAAAVAVLVPASFATGPARAEVVKPGEEGGALGLTPGKIPDILKKAKADPYAAPPAPACQSIPREIAALDAVLGPDADAPAQKQKTSDQAGSFITSTLLDQIPYRGVVRFVTGASKRDKERTEAAMAGWTRRGYLKGMEINLGCADRQAGEPPPVQAAAPTPAPAQPVIQIAAAPQAAPLPASAPTVRTSFAPPAPSTEDAAETAAAHTPAPIERAAPAPGTLDAQMAEMEGRQVASASSTPRSSLVQPASYPTTYGR